MSYSDVDRKHLKEVEKYLNFRWGALMNYWPPNSATKILQKADAEIYDFWNWYWIRQYQEGLEGEGR